MALITAGYKRNGSGRVGMRDQAKQAAKVTVTEVSLCIISWKKIVIRPFPRPAAALAACSGAFAI